MCMYEQFVTTKLDHICSFFGSGMVVQSFSDIDMHGNVYTHMYLYLPACFPLFIFVFPCFDRHIYHSWDVLVIQDQSRFSNLTLSSWSCGRMVFCPVLYNLFRKELQFCVARTHRFYMFFVAPTPMYVPEIPKTYRRNHLLKVWSEGIHPWKLTSNPKITKL